VCCSVQPKSPSKQIRPRCVPHGQQADVHRSRGGELLGISRALAYELVGRHELPAVRLGRRLVIPRRALEALLDTNDAQV
jgi:excisionase family DNA binding protein